MLSPWLELMSEVTVINDDFVREHARVCVCDEPVSISKILDFNSTMLHLMGQEDFITFIHCENFRF